MIPRRRAGAATAAASSAAQQQPQQEQQQRVVSSSTSGSNRNSFRSSDNKNGINKGHQQQKQSRSSSSPMWKGIFLLMAALLGYYVPTMFFVVITGGRGGGKNNSNNSAKHHRRDTSLSLPYTYDKPPAVIATSFYGVKARAFPKHPMKCYNKHQKGGGGGDGDDEDEDESASSDPMSDEYHDRPSQVGFLYQRLLKSVSTTSASVNIRIALNMANGKPHSKNQERMDICDHRVGFGLDADSPFATRFINRDPIKSFLWTTIRLPSSRYTSHFFHQMVARKQRNPTDKVFQSWLKGLPTDYYLCALSTQGYNPSMTDNHVEVVDMLVGSGTNGLAPPGAGKPKPKQKAAGGGGGGGRQAAMMNRQQQRHQRHQNTRKLTSLADAGIVPDPKNAIPHKINPSWLRDNPNKGRKDLKRDLMKEGAVAYVFKEGSRNDVGGGGGVADEDTNNKQQQQEQHRRLGSSTVRGLGDDANNNVDPRIDVANSIIQEYDFIAVAERFEESMVALMMILDIPMASIIHLPMKLTPGFDDGINGQCYFMWKPFITKGMQFFFDSPIWLEQTRPDLSLYNAADKSLDMTIHKLGVRKFEKNMGRFLYAQRIAKERCWGRITTPCDMGGRIMEETDCWHRDSGCGNDCLDQVATELGLW